MKKAFLIIVLCISSIFFSCKKDKDKNQAASKTVQSAVSDSITDDGWPRETANNGTKLVYYQPQVDDWKDYKEITARLAFSLTPKDGKQVLGVASLKAETLVDKDNRNVLFKNVQVTDVRFPALDEKKVPEMEKLFKETLPKGGDPISVDRILADLNQTKSPSKGIAGKNDPPAIFYSTNPAVLLIVQGEPVLVPVEKTDIQYVVNTNWDLFFDKTTKDYFLLADNVWVTSKTLDGKWVKTTQLPSGLSNLPSGQNFDDLKNAIPPPSGGTAPQIFYSSKPAELIAINGTPKFIKIDGTKLLYIDNTENDIFANEGDGQYYVLLSGRWFKSAALTGPWTYGGNNLPADFAKIPKDSPRANVLASVPGTQEAKDAVMLAQVPTTAIINKADAEAKAKVTYDGTPQFKPIEGTKMQYASNTQDKVIKVGDLYYLCFQAVWFMSTSPNGPWKTADSVPKEIYTIPPSSPVYNVTYVTQTTTDTTVESSTTAGYLGAFIIGATVGAILTYGTGYYYPPYVYYGGLYPIYRPWPYTYGGGAVYNPWTGGWAAGRSVYGPYGAAGTSAWYNPATGRYGRSASVQGWYGGRTAASTYNPWTGNYARTNQGHNAYAQWGHSAATNGRQWVESGHVTTRRGTAIGYETSGGQKGVITHHRGGGTTIHTNNNVYAGHDGHVYKKDANGNWSHYNNGNGGWTQAGKLGSSKNPGSAIERNKPNENIGGATRAGDRIQNKNLPKQDQNLGGGNRLGDGVQHDNFPKANQTLGQREKPLGEPGRSDITNDLDRSALSRDRGESQTRNFQNFQREGNRLGGGNLRGGGGFRGRR
ncbi:hypothetical protein [Flavobacterium sp. KBS0721]|uniref:hypothetical protein n=1 Tax=Flavobacterium sp. KBS0721 TaxID=1179672 RepID=UPI00098EFBFD|nr:hypothetical protein [Flavobacterium sp. KBS0721]QDW22147.1 hypothetical protein B0M43_0019185 [Flavobacterium sp. KBS0721]